MKQNPTPLSVAEAHRLINSRQLREIFPVSLMTFWRWEKQGKWPKRIKRFGRNYWHLSQVLDVIDQMASEGRRDAGK
jgi:predicted DNA-binding transcriptional regulator AlpA